jgi:hypothetical protein
MEDAEFMSRRFLALFAPMGEHSLGKPVQGDTPAMRTGGTQPTASGGTPDAFARVFPLHPGGRFPHRT